MSETDAQAAPDPPAAPERRIGIWLVTGSILVPLIVLIGAISWLRGSSEPTSTEPTTEVVAGESTTTSPLGASTSRPPTAPKTTSPPVATATTATVTLSQLVGEIERDLARERPGAPPSRIECDRDESTMLGAGSVLYCETAGPESFEEASVLIVVLDGTGRAAYTTATDLVRLHASYGSGLPCSDLLGVPYLDGLPDSTRYLFALAYWFEDGEPEVMDADGDGVPCETSFDPATVEGVMLGGLVE